MGVLDIASNTVPAASPIKVKLVKEVIKVRANIKFRAFAENFVARKSKRFAQSCVHVEVAGPPERVARHSWGWQRTVTLLAAGAYCRIRVREETLELSSRRYARRSEEPLTTTQSATGHGGVAAEVRLKAAIEAGGEKRP